MKTYIIILASLILFLVISCDNIDVSNNSRYNYGYKIDHVYKIKEDVLLSSKYSHLIRIRSTNEELINNKEYYLGIISVSTKFKVTKLIYHPKRFSGTIDVEGLILDGEFKGKTINASYLIKRGEDGRHAYPDEDIVEDLGIEKTDK